MAVIKSLKIGNTTANVLDDDIPVDQEKYKQNLLNLYNVTNEIAQDELEKGNNLYDKWFANEKMLEQMKNDNSYNRL